MEKAAIVILQSKDRQQMRMNVNQKECIRKHVQWSGACNVLMTFQISLFSSTESWAARNYIGIVC